MANPTVSNGSANSSSVPEYVFEYAPLVYLASDEVYFPSDIASQLTHTTPYNNLTPITSGYPTPLTLSNLSSLNSLGGTKVYLTSKDDITVSPPLQWLRGVKPDSSGNATGTKSCAIIHLAHADGHTVDVFYHYFYAYNRGNYVLDTLYGDHVGDWEFMMVRFKDGKPQAVWYSQHALGEAFEYKVLHKGPDGKRPIGYSAQGSHANYAISGTHDHAIPNFDLPFGFVEDHCSKGALWDPTLTAYIYHADPTGKIFTPYNGVDPTDWLKFDGQWGDQQYPKNHKGQSETFGDDKLAKYVGGPNGPQWKHLVRKNMWPDGTKGSPIVRSILTV